MSIQTRALKLLGACYRGLPNCRGKSRLGKLLERLAERSACQIVVPLKTEPPCLLRCPLDDYLGRAIFVHGLYYMEQTENAAMLAKLRPGNIAFDIGANIGYYTVQFAKAVAPHGQVHAFEPSKRNFARLVRNLEINEMHEVHANQRAASSNSDPLKIDVPDPTNLGRTQTVPGVLPEESVPSGTIDEYVSAHGIEEIDLVKVDVEGWEMQVLRGMQGLLRKGAVAHLFVEMNNELLARAGSTIDDLIEFMSMHGYKAARIRRGTPPRYERYLGTNESLVYFQPRP